MVRMKWNQLFILFLSLSLFSSCKNHYRIEGSSSISLLDGQMLFLKVPVGDEMVKIDSAEVIHGSFSMGGKVDSTVLASLYMDSHNIMPIVLEKGNIVLSIDNVKFSVSGTPLNDILYAYIEKRTAIENELHELKQKESRMILEGESQTIIDMEVNQVRYYIMQERTALNKHFIQDNYTNLLGPSLFLMICDGYEKPILTRFLSQILNEAPTSFREHPQIKSYVKRARSYAREHQSDFEEQSNEFSTFSVDY
ncbi:MAG: DUF4369 domain-containing protein [Phocaeicola sp.]